MIFYFDGNGNPISSEPTRVYQGSNKASRIYFIAPIIKSAIINVTFSLPNGEKTTPYLMTKDNVLNGIQDSKGFDFISFILDLDKSITSYYGEVTCQFFATIGDEIITTASSVFTVEKGVPPIEPVKTDSYEQIVSFLSSIQTNINNNEEAIEDINKKIPSSAGENNKLVDEQRLKEAIEDINIDINIENGQGDYSLQTNDKSNEIKGKGSAGFGRHLKEFDIPTGDGYNSFSGYNNKVTAGVKNSMSGDSNEVSNGHYNTMTCYKNKATNSSFNMVGCYENTLENSNNNVVGGFQNKLLNAIYCLVGGYINELENVETSLNSGRFNKLKNIIDSAILGKFFNAEDINCSILLGNGKQDDDGIGYKDIVLSLIQGSHSKVKGVGSCIILGDSHNIYANESTTEDYGQPIIWCFVNGWGNEIISENLQDEKAFIFLHGSRLKAIKSHQTFYGYYNKYSEDILFGIGDGEGENNRHNAFSVLEGRYNNGKAKGIKIGNTTLSEEKLEKLLALLGD